MTRGGPPVHRPRHRVVTPEEARVWRAVVRDVAPLPGHDLDETVAEPQPTADTAPPPLTAPAPPAVAPPPSRRDGAALPPLSHGTTPGLDRRSAERMRRGEMVIDTTLDLHGMDQDQAHGALVSVLSRAYESGRRCVLVITGKGRQGSGILRAQVPRWLNQSPLRERILGFSHARPQHGGEGALYVLIKRRRP